MSNIFQNLNSDEQKVVELVTERLHMGRTKYGYLNAQTDRRDMLRESIEEILDCLVYLSAKLIQLSNNNKPPRMGEGDTMDRNIELSPANQEALDKMIEEAVERALDARHEEIKKSIATKLWTVKPGRLEMLGFEKRGKSE